MRYDFDIRMDEDGNFKVRGLKPTTINTIRIMVAKGGDPLPKFLPLLQERLTKLWPDKKFTIGKMAQTSNRFYVWID